MNWDIEWAKNQIKSGGRFGPARVRAKVYELNRELFELWADGLPTGIAGGLGDRNALLQGTRVYIRAFDVNDAPACGETLRTGCVNEDCIEVAKNLIDEGLKPAILNLASRRHPCGGYDKGLRAQEETLCRSSTLSQSLYQLYDDKYKCVRDARVTMRPKAYPLDIDFGGVYSPDVTFFREGKSKLYAFREQPFKCGVISVAALSFRDANRYCNDELHFRAPDGGFTPQGEAVQLNKVRTIFRIALKNGHDSIVLGAFGCGVNRLPSAAVANQFKKVLEEQEFKGKFKAVVFAIMEGRGSARKPVEENGKFAPFYAVFGRWAW